MIAGRVGATRIEDRELTVKANRRTRHQRHAGLHAGAIDRMAGGEIVAAVEHDAHLRDRIEQGITGQPMRKRDHLDARIGLKQGLAP